MEHTLAAQFKIIKPHTNECVSSRHICCTFVLTSCNRHAYFKMLRNALHNAVRKILQDNMMYICL